MITAAWYAGVGLGLTIGLVVGAVLGGLAALYLIHYENVRLIHRLHERRR